jgi:Spy/CpxP family protein refolding chaperone
MKHLMKHTAFWLLMVAGFASTLSAQPSPEGRPQGRPSQDGSGGDRPFATGMAGRFGPAGERLLSVLTQDQKSSLRAAMEKQREKSRELEEQLRDARRELVTLGFSGKFDEAAIREKAMAAAKLEAELTVLRAKALSEMRPPLNAEQLEKLRSAGPMNEGADRSETPRRRQDIPRDENGLPKKVELPKP